MRSAIGGYFELELPHFPEYHSEALAFNSGRFCLEYLLRHRHYRKLYVPYYTCDTVLEPILKLGIPYEFYHITETYRLEDSLPVSEGEALIYTNYWGLHNNYCEKLAKQYGKSLILDYTQAFYARPIGGIDTFYSCRKFFGVPDGGYLYTDLQDDCTMEEDKSFTRMDSLVKRIDISPEAGYDDFQRVSDEFCSLEIRKMSRFTKRMLQGINYCEIAQRRRDNYDYLQRHLGGEPLNADEVPMVFPYVSEEGQALRKKLIDKKIFVAKYWPNVEEWAGEDALETWLSNHVLPLPLDQRYDIQDMKVIVSAIDNQMTPIQVR